MKIYVIPRRNEPSSQGKNSAALSATLVRRGGLPCSSMQDNLVRYTLRPSSPRLCVWVQSAYITSVGLEPYRGFHGLRRCRYREEKKNVPFAGLPFTLTLCEGVQVSVTQPKLQAPSSCDWTTLSDSSNSEMYPFVEPKKWLTGTRHARTQVTTWNDCR